VLGAVKEDIVSTGRNDNEKFVKVVTGCIIGLCRAQHTVGENVENKWSSQRSRRCLTGVAESPPRLAG